MDNFEKPARRSKKFLMTLLTQGVLTAIDVLALLLGETSVAMTTVMVTATAGIVFMGAGYVGGVAWLDKWVRVAKINANTPALPTGCSGCSGHQHPQISQEQEDEEQP